MKIKIILFFILFASLLGTYQRILGDSYDFQQPNCLVDVGYSYGSASAQQLPAAISIGVLLVEFSNRIHYTDTTDHPNGYSVQDFENLLFSDDYYYTENPIPVRSPDNEQVFGSLTDWYQENSHGLIQITGDVINPDTAGIPTWLNMGNFATYNSLLATRTLIESAVRRAVNDSSWNCNYNIICVIVAGDGYHNVAWHGSANIGGSTNYRLRQNNMPSGTALFNWNNLWGGYTTMERWHGDLASQSNTFTHVAPHAHESFHVIGHGLNGRWYDQNLQNSPMGDWCVMHRL